MHKFAGLASAILLAILTINISLTLPIEATNEGYWVTKTAPIEKGADISNAAVVDGKIYTISGGFLTDHVKDTEIYDPQTDNWTTKTPMPTSRMYFASAAYNNKIYCIGGTIGTDKFLGLNEVYDTQTDTWTNKTSMPTPRSWLQANTVNDKIYLIGGLTPTPSDRYGEPTGINEAYNPETNTWETKAPMPQPAYWYSSTVVNNRIYVFGAGLTQIYDPETDTWTNGTACQQGNKASAAVATTGEHVPVRIYVFGGGQGFYNFLYDNYNRIYDPANDSWSNGTPLPDAIGGVAAVNINDTLYVVGGKNGVDGPVQILNINLQYIPADYGTTNTPTPSTSPTPTQTPTNSPNLQTIWIITGTGTACGIIGLTTIWTKKKHHTNEKDT
jgi:hypothetical protein